MMNEVTSETTDYHSPEHYGSLDMDVPADLILRTHDHPEAGGRQPQHAEVGWTVRMTLEDGKVLDLKMGQDGLDNLERIIFQVKNAQALEAIGIKI